MTVDPLAGAMAAFIVFIIPRVEWLGLAIVAGGMGLVALEVALDSPAHSIAWPGHFEILHVPVTAAVVMVAAWLALEPADHSAAQAPGGSS